MMMDKIKSYFDDFTFHARVMPVIVLLLPIMVIDIYKGIVDASLVEGSILLIIIIAFFEIGSRAVRECGKICEDKMYKHLGGMPSTIILRFSDSTFDSVTKQRYHRILNRFEGLTLPLDAKNETSDQQYSSAANLLRNYANSNRDKEPRCYQELKEYNFWRNLYGIKAITLIFYSMLAVREVILIEKFNLKQAFIDPYPDYIALVVLALSIVFVVFCVNRKTVIRRGIDYAKALIEVCERIPCEVHDRKNS